jgi:putative acetyltransferase
MSEELAPAFGAGGDGGGLPLGVGKAVGGRATPPMLVRAARDRDAAALLDLVRGAWSEFPGKELVVARDAPDLVAPATSYARQGGAFWVVERGGAIVGSIALRPAAGGTVELRRFYVAPGERKSGLGAYLYGLFEEEAVRRGAHGIELWTDARMLDAQRLYQRVGFRRSAEERLCPETGIFRYRYEKLLDAAPVSVAGLLERLSREPWRVAPAGAS